MMDTPFFERTVPFSLDLVFRQGMGRRLLLCIFTVAMLPTMLIGWINYQAAYHHLDQDIKKTIRLNAELKSQQINAYLHGRMTDAERHGREPATIAFFNALVRRHQAAEEPLSEFVLSPPWNAAVSAFGSGIQLHADLHGYHDILLIDGDGNIIFSSSNAPTLTGNLNQIEKKSPIRAAFRKTLETGIPTFSGFESGVAETTGVRAFITAAIGSMDDPPAGVIAFTIPGGDIQQLIQLPPEPDKNVRIYLIDKDLTLLAGTIAGQRPDTRLTIKTAIAQQWGDAIANDKSALPPSSLLEYQDPGGHWMVGTYASIQVDRTPYALVVEVDRTMALSTIHRQQKIVFTVLILTGLGIIAVSVILSRVLVEPVRDLTKQVTLATRDQQRNLPAISASHEIGQLATVCNDLIKHIHALSIEHEIQSRLVAGMASLHRLLGGTPEPETLCFRALEFLSDFLDLDRADFFIGTEDGRFACACHFPGRPTGECDLVISPGEGRIGRAIHEKTMLAFRKDAVEASIIPVPTADLGNIVAVPLVLEESVIGVVEAQKIGVFSLFESHFLQTAAPFIAMALGAALVREKEMALIEKTRQQADQLSRRETELEKNTQALQSQRQAFKKSEQVLQLKHLELEAANAQMVKNAADLEANMATLEQQKKDMQKQNAELEKAHRELADKARQLEISSQYKTEFMANMSHELRTPLNSILLLSRLLLENTSNTLSPKQAEFAQTINSAGEDLLNLINEILDLAKVESGKIDIESEPVAIKSIAQAMQASFAPLAEQSGVVFSIDVAKDVPERLVSDRKRISQIVKNFLSNAFKFTSRGRIQLAFSTGAEPPNGQSAGPADDAGWLSISVDDTGIGIPTDKQQLVFDAFQQADGSTRRKYGGTGLGLSISRELAHMLGGEISLTSEEGKGSCFTLHLPIVLPSTEEPKMIRDDTPKRTAEPTPSSSTVNDDSTVQQGCELVPDDRHRLVHGNPCILIMDTDVKTIDPIMDVARDQGYKVVVAEQRMTGLHLADYYQPVAVFINPQSCGPDGWPVIHQIKANVQNHHIPIFTLSGQDEKPLAAAHGAAGHIRVPPAKSRLALAFQQIETWQSQNERNVLVVASDPQTVSDRIRSGIDIESIHFTIASTAAAAAKILQAQTMAAAILEPTMDIAELQRFLTIWQTHPIALVIFTDVALTADVKAAITPFVQVDELPFVDTVDQLLVKLLACLHLPPDALETACRQRLGALIGHRYPLQGRKVLLVDDDMRTVFAVTSALEAQGVEVCTGKTGKESLDKLNRFPDIDLVLMDVMINEIDGYAAIQQIRQQKHYRHIPILALTAKAMQGDRAKCIEAGADDYLAKPVNLEKLTSMLKIWLDPGLAQPQ